MLASVLLKRFIYLHVLRSLCKLRCKWKLSNSFEIDSTLVCKNTKRKQIVDNWGKDVH